MCITAKPKAERGGWFGNIRKWKLSDHNFENEVCKPVGKIGCFIRFHPRTYLVNETIEMLKEKKENKIQLMKEVKDIQAETEAKLNKLIDIIEGDNDILDQNPKLADALKKLSQK